MPDNEDSKMKETQRAGLGFWSTRSVREDDEELRPVTNIRGIKSIPGGPGAHPQTLHTQNASVPLTQTRVWQTPSTQGQIVNILCFVGHLVSVAMIPLYGYSTNAAIDDTDTDELA